MAAATKNMLAVGRTPLARLMLCAAISFFALFPSGVAGAGAVDLQQLPEHLRGLSEEALMQAVMRMSEQDVLEEQARQAARAAEQVEDDRRRAAEEVARRQQEEEEADADDEELQFALRLSQLEQEERDRKDAVAREEARVAEQRRREEQEQEVIRQRQADEWAEARRQDLARMRPTNAEEEAAMLQEVMELSLLDVAAPEARRPSPGASSSSKQRLPVPQYEEELGAAPAPHQSFARAHPAREPHANHTRTPDAPAPKAFLAQQHAAAPRPSPTSAEATGTDNTFVAHLAGALQKIQAATDHADKRQILKLELQEAIRRYADQLHPKPVRMLVLAGEVAKYSSLFDGLFMGDLVSPPPRQNVQAAKEFAAQPPVLNVSAPPRPENLHIIYALRPGFSSRSDFPTEALGLRLGLERKLAQYDPKNGVTTGFISLDNSTLRASPAAAGYDDTPSLVYDLHARLPDLLLGGGADGDGGVDLVLSQRMVCPCQCRENRGDDNCGALSMDPTSGAFRALAQYVMKPEGVQIHESPSQKVGASGGFCSSSFSGGSAGKTEAAMQAAFADVSEKLLAGSVGHLAEVLERRGAGVPRVITATMDGMPDSHGPGVVGTVFLLKGSAATPESRAHQAEAIKRTRFPPALQQLQRLFDNMRAFADRVQQEAGAYPSVAALAKRRADRYRVCAEQMKDAEGSFVEDHAIAIERLTACLQARVGGMGSEALLEADSVGISLLKKTAEGAGGGFNALTLALAQVGESRNFCPIVMRKRSSQTVSLTFAALRHKNFPIFQVRGFGHGMRAWRFDVLLAALAVPPVGRNDHPLGSFLRDRVHSWADYGEDVSGTPLNPAALDIRRIMALVNPPRA